MNKPETTFDAKQWVETWKKAGPELERIRNEELRNMDPEEGLRFLGAFADRGIRISGLIEQQSWFMRWRVKMLLKKLGEQ